MMIKARSLHFPPEFQPLIASGWRPELHQHTRRDHTTTQSTDTELNNSFYVVRVYRCLPSGALTCPPEKLLPRRTQSSVWLNSQALTEMSRPPAQIQGAKDQTHLQQKGCHQLAGKNGNSIKPGQTTQITWTHAHAKHRFECGEWFG